MLVDEDVPDVDQLVVPDDHVLVRHSPALAALHPAPTGVITVQLDIGMIQNLQQ